MTPEDEGPAAVGPDDVGSRDVEPETLKSETLKSETLKPEPEVAAAESEIADDELAKPVPEPEVAKSEVATPEVATPEPEPEPEPATPEVAQPHRHRRRFGRGPLLAALLLAALGFSLVVQVRQTSVVGIASLNQSELVQILGTVTGQSQKVEEETQELLRTQADLRSGSDRAAAAEKTARERIETLGILAGTVAAEGPGVQLTMADGQKAVSSSAVLNAVQELRDAGAEAMQINSPAGTARIVASTSFTDDLGNGGLGGIKVDGHALRSPYTIVAIGDPDTMNPALNIPGGVIDALQQSGAAGSVLSSKSVTVTAVVDQPRTGYASPGAG